MREQRQKKETAEKATRAKTRSENTATKKATQAQKASQKEQKATTKGILKVPVNKETKAVVKG